MHGNYAAAETAARDLLKRDGQSFRFEGAKRLTATLAIRGRFADARKAATQMDDERFPALARLHLVAGDQRAALAALAQAEQQTDDYRSVIALGWAEAGNAARAEAALAEYERTRTPAELRLTEPQRRALRGVIALARNQPQRALELLSDTVSYCVSCQLPFIGRALEQLGRTDQAIAAYTTYITRATSSRADLDPFYRAPILERLAQMHDTAGRRAEAQEYYARFVDVWKNADPELQPRVHAARNRLQQLVRGAG